MRNKMSFVKLFCWPMVLGYFCLGTSLYCMELVEDFQKATQSIKNVAIYSRPEEDTDFFFYRIFGLLNDKDLARSCQVSWQWRNIVTWFREKEAREYLRTSKLPLFSKILEITDAQPNVVQRTRDLLGGFVGEAFGKEMSEKDIRQRLLQPEALLLNNQSLREKLIAGPSSEGEALAILRALACELGQKGGLLKDVQAFYTSYLRAFDEQLPSVAKHMRSKAILTGEGFLQESSSDAPCSYRISQENALEILAKDENSGVSFKNCVFGLPIGMESALYHLYQVLFKRGVVPSALLTLNEVDNVVPQETSLSLAYDKARKEGQSYDDFCADHFFSDKYIEEKFTQKCPTHVVQAREQVAGISLEAFINGVEKGSYSFDDLDLSSFSEHVLMSILTIPSEVGPDIFMIKMDSKPYQIICTGPIAASSSAFAGVKDNAVNNILYHLPLMDKYVDERVLDSLIRSSAEECFLTWLHLLERNEKAYAQLLEAHYDNDALKSIPYLEKDNYQEVLGLPLRIYRIFLNNFVIVYKAVQRIVSNDRPVTHWDLLQRVQPLIARSHEEKQNGSLLERWSGLDDPSKKLKRPPKEENDFNHVNVGDAKLEFLSQVNILQMPASFLAEAVNQLQELNGELFDRVLCTLHSSWKDYILLIYAFEKGVSPDVIPFLLNCLKASPLAIDNRQKTLGWSVLRHIVAGHYPHYMLKRVDNWWHEKRFENDSSLSKELFKRVIQAKRQEWLDHQSNDRLTALDEALLKKSVSSFITLVELGCTVCDSSLIRAFYREVVQESEDERLHEAFMKLVNRNDKLRWQACLKTLFKPYQQTDEDYTLELSKGNRLIMPQFLFQNSSEHRSGSYLVPKGSSELFLDQGLCWRIASLPGKEAAAGSLIRLILGYGAPQTALAKVYGRNGQVFPLQLSQIRSGSYGLQDALEQNPEVINKLDEASVSGMILVSMLLNSKGSDYVLEPHPVKDSYRIIANNNEDTFAFDVPGISMVYCFNQMNKPIAPEISAFFVSRDPRKLLEGWLEELTGLHHVSLCDNNERFEFLKDYNCFIGIPLQSGMIEKLYDILLLIKVILENDPSITHYGLLRKINPSLAKKIKKALANQDLTPLQRYKQISEGGKDSDNRQQGVPYRGNGYSVTLALNELKKIAKKRKYEWREESGEDDRFLRPLRILGWEKFLAGLSWADLTVSQRKILLKHIRNKPMEKLVFKKCPELTDNFLTKNLSLKDLTRVNLSGCKGITWVTLSALAKEALGLTELNLSNISTLQKIGDLGYVTDAPLIFAALKKCKLSNCNKLRKLLIKAPELLYLNVKNCALSDAMLDDVIKESPKLVELHVDGATNITQKELRKKYPVYTLNFMHDAYKKGCECYFSQKYEQAYEFFSLAAEQGNADALHKLGMMDLKGQGVEKSNEKAFQRFDLAAKLGNTDASYELGLLYEKGEGVEQRPILAAMAYNAAADKDHTAAQYRLGLLYEKGLGVDMSPTNAAEYYKKAADNGHEDAQYRHGLMYEFALGVPLSYENAFNLYRKYADRGNAFIRCYLPIFMYEKELGTEADYKVALGWCVEEAVWDKPIAYYSMGLIRDKGLGVKKDAKMALDAYKASAYKGYARAQSDLPVFMYASGLGTDQDYKQAFTWCEGLAKEGDKRAQYSLGLLYQKGLGVDQNYSKAFEAYKASADQGYPPGQCNLGVLYEKGLGVAPDYTMAFRLYKASADDDDPSGLYQLGLLYEQGLGTAKNTALAFKKYEKSAKRGDARAQYKYGLSYEKGLGVNEDFQEAAKWYKKSVDQGYAKAQYALASLYEQGVGVSRDYEKAISLYEASAEQNDPYALYRLSLFYRKGQSVNQGFEEAETLANKGNVAAQYDLGGMYIAKGIFEEAALWYKNAAEQSHIDAQFSLGVLYHKGLGVSQDYKQAVYWYEKAADLGSASACINLGMLFQGGLGVNQDCTKAAELYLKGAEQSEPVAFYCIAFLKSKGIVIPSKNPEMIEVSSLYEKAFRLCTSREFLDSSVLNTLGCMYKLGRGTKKNVSEAHSCFEVTCKMGSTYGKACLGRLYKEGLGVKQDLKKAFSLIEESAEQEEGIGLYELALMYRDGEGVKKDDKKAVELLTKAVEKYQHADSFYALGWMYEEGRGAAVDPEVAKKCYEAGLNRFAEDALYLIGRAYEYGLGVQRDVCMAKKWYQKAADLGYEPALEKLK